MSDEAKQKSAMDCFNRGSEAVRSGNFDYAIEMFMTAVKLVPDNLIFRQALRGAERKLYKDNRKGAGMAGLKMKPAQARLQIAKKRTKWPDVMEAAEDALRYNPWDTGMLYELGNAASELGMQQVGIWVLETAYEADKNNANAMRLLATLYEQTAQYDRAIIAWETVKKIDPTDQDAAAKARQLAASATIQKGKYDNAESFQETMRSTGGKGGEVTAAKIMSPEERAKSEIAALEAKIAADPANANLYVQLGDRYRDLPDPQKAIAAYQKGLDATGGSRTLPVPDGSESERLHGALRARQATPQVPSAG
jgi:tetratricopeptide (TPR) repeat protein